VLCHEHRDGATLRTYIPCISYGKPAERVSELDEGDGIGVQGKWSWRAASKEGSKPGCLEVFCMRVETERVAVAPAAGSAN
jgi:hypothetical protein